MIKFHIFYLIILGMIRQNKILKNRILCFYFANKVVFYVFNWSVVVTSYLSTSCIVICMDYRAKMEFVAGDYAF